MNEDTTIRLIDESEVVVIVAFDISIPSACLQHGIAKQDVQIQSRNQFSKSSTLKKDS